MVLVSLKARAMASSFIRTSSTAVAARTAARRHVGQAAFASSSLAWSLSMPTGEVRSAARTCWSPSWTTTTTTSIRGMSTAAASTAEKSVSRPDMFCRQCEQTADHYACTVVGVCGKTAETAAMQDALMEIVKSVSLWYQAAAASSAPSAEVQAKLDQINMWTLEATFSTLTNVNFSDSRVADYCAQGEALKHELKALLPGSVKPAAQLAAVADLNLSTATSDEFEAFGLTVSVPKRAAIINHVDAASLHEVCTYGLKGLCAYACHVRALAGGSALLKESGVYDAVQDIFATLADTSITDLNHWLGLMQKVGTTNTTVMALLDQAHCENFGAPEPTAVRTTPVAGKCILVSGHDLVDLYALLQQTEGTGIQVYTHGEMLPAHSYPKLRGFAHLAGNYGTAWQNQKFEFASFPGPVVVTTNCVLEPRRMYRDRLYTMNATGVDGVKHIGPDRDFSEVIDHALHCKGFAKTAEPPQYHTVGFNHRAVLPLAKQVIDAVQAGQLSRIFLIGGCDGSQWDRSYFTDLAEETPSDSLILTLGCAKNRLIHSPKLQNATLANGMPRVLDMGQCNDSYSAVVVATELAKALNCTINDLPLSLAVSHLEQKAAAVLLTLLSLGVKNIRLGPTLPAYLTPNVLQLLHKEYNLMATGDVQQDLKAMMSGN